ncbi:uncharacterized protein BCR38DRAFT_487018 [Pseudomassariella vexata]|uniref:Berberine/berberine-like domain-containing protein n=1 Tax=Pseudomassariella vexata TaxID=1141098 RepID=A0A1Y2DPP5_9PEZI|nr:uncharacterized protein BCR38DRAFT_487018 [Pseudomassariella vexata]ORY61263.1 hypothetical protein BCR38DRAFT_487018 [Pseudomassariella vexata]
MATRTYPEGIVAGGRFSFDISGVWTETYWYATARLYNFMLNCTDNGNTLTWAQTNTTFTALSEPDYGPLPYGNEMAATSIFTSRILPRSLFTNPSSPESQRVMDVLKCITNARDGRFTFGYHAISVGNWSGSDNAVLSIWRDAMALCVIISLWDRSVPFDDMLGLKEFTVDDLVPALEEATPSGGIYMNEIDPLYRGNWKMTGFGDDKYDPLLEIRNKYDPDHILWSPMSVGGDEHTTDAAGRVCKA